MVEPTPDPIEQALDLLRSTVRAKIRAEQLRDPLTGLANLEALDTWITDNTAGGADFWIAFVEVDRFKSLNDEFGYDRADTFLVALGEQLKNAATHFFPQGAVPFRAHGDEFYIGGPLADSADGDIERALNVTAGNIAQLQVLVPVEETRKLMRGTASIGWLTTMDARKSEGGQTLHGVKELLELAVAAAKLNRGSVVRWTKSLTRHDTVHDRADCSDCETKFELRIKIARRAEAPLYCPQCGKSVDRPAGLRP